MSEAEWKKTWEEKIVKGKTTAKAFDWQAEAFRVEAEAELVSERGIVIVQQKKLIPRECLRELRRTQHDKIPCALVKDEKLGYCVLVTQGQGPGFAYVQHDPTKNRQRCAQCEDPNLKGIHTCRQKKQRILVKRPRRYKVDELKTEKAINRNRTIYVTVSGTAGSGKTTIALLIAKALRDADIKGNITDCDLTDSELTMMAMDNYKRVASLATLEGFNVKVRTKQRRRR